MSQKSEENKSQVKASQLRPCHQQSLIAQKWRCKAKRMDRQSKEINSWDKMWYSKVYIMSDTALDQSLVNTS